MKPERKILHIDMDAFFASVEQRDFPHLLGQPVVVGGSRNDRGVVAAASYEARRFGVRSAMPMAQAFRLCPQLIRQPHRMGVYSQESQRIREIFADYSDRVEPLSIDEAFLDVSNTSATQAITATKIALEIKSKILSETGLTATAGVAPNKFLAKIASGKNKPNGLTVVLPEQIQDFLGPLEVSNLWGVGPTTAKKLHRIGITTIGELQFLSLPELTALFGKSGLAFFQLCRGIDDRPVEARGAPKSLSTETTFASDLCDPMELQHNIRLQAADLSRRMERAGFLGVTTTLKLRYSDFDTVTRSKTRNDPFRDSQSIFAAALDLLEKTDYSQRPVRLLGLGMSGLVADFAPVQLSLFSEGSRADGDT